MTRQAFVGLFTIVALIGLFGIFFVLANVGTQGRYKIGVHFKSAAGLHKGALVYESGVVVGVVDATQLQPNDFTVDVILAIDNSVDVPRTARFLIQAPLTGDSTLEIVPPQPPPPQPGINAPAQRPTAVAILPHAVLPIEEQPQGTNPATIQDLLDQGQGEVKRLDTMLAELQRQEPQLLATLQSALDNANQLSSNANAKISDLANRVDNLTAGLQVALDKNSANISDLTSQVDLTVRRNSGQIDTLLASLNASARSLNATADSVQQLATNPQVKQNLLDTTRGIAQTATTIASLAGDLRTVTGNPQTQAQLRDTIANVDAATQKTNAILGSLGGTSSVYGVDPGATPAPGTSPGPAGPGGPRSPGTKPGTLQGNLKDKVAGIIRNVIALQVRVSEYDHQRRGTTSTPLLGRDTGPSTDFNAVVLPHGSQYLVTGFNDIGGPHSTANFIGMATVRPHLQLGGGVLYSRLGARAVYNPGTTGLGFEGRVYDLRHPTADGYLNLKLGDGLQLFGGERDALRNGRRATFGLQYQF